MTQVKDMMDKTRSTPPRKSVPIILSEMAENSSLHGIPKIVTAKHIFVKILWVLLFMATTGFMIKQLYSLFDHYYSWPVKTKVSLNFSALKFPAISFCNMNPIRRSKLEKAPEELQDILNPKKKVKVNQRRKRELAGSYSSFTVYLTATPSLMSSVSEVTATPLSVFSDSMFLSSSLDASPSEIISSSLTVGDSVEITNTNTNLKTSYLDDASPTTEPLSTYSNNMMTSAEYSSDSGGMFPSYPLSSTVEDWYSDYPPSPLSDYGESSYGDVSYDYLSQDFWDYWWNGYDTSYSGDSSNWYYTANDYWNSQYDDFTDYWYDDEDKPQKDKWQERVEHFKEVFSNSSRDERIKLGHQIEDMLLSCALGGRVCTKDDFTHFLSADYGNCYTIENIKYSSRISGPNHGLALTLNIETEEYVTNFATGYGIRLVIHEPGTYPFPFEEGLTISTGYETSIGLRMIKIIRMGNPYGNCESGYEFKTKYHIDYSTPACILICKQNLIEDICKCQMSEAMDLNNTASTSNGTVLCEQRKHGACINVINLKYLMGDLNCTCQAPCWEILYEKTLSGRSWPNKDYLTMALVEDICRRNMSSFQDQCATFNENNNVDQAWWTENFMKVIVYYEDLNYQTIEEEPLYDTVRFISDIGGTLGLFMGASVLSAFEFLQVFVELGILFYRRMKQRQEVHKVNVKEAENNDKGGFVDNVSSKVTPHDYNTMFRPNYST